MKHQHRRAFTLIEMLVVIAIIAILASLLFPAVSRTLKSAKSNRAQQEAGSIENAVALYWSDYGHLPIPMEDHGGSDDDVDASGMDDTSKGIILVLTADNTQLNPREKVYLSMEKPSDDGEFLDPWGTQYRIVLDKNMDGKIDYLSPDDKQHRKRAVVVSAGPDRDFTETDDNVANVELPEKGE